MKKKEYAPLFTGEVLRDSSVAEVEKAAEASLGICEGVKALLGRKTIEANNVAGLREGLAKV